MPYCETCGSYSRTAARFCRTCGAPRFPTPAAVSLPYRPTFPGGGLPGHRSAPVGVQVVAYLAIMLSALGALACPLLLLVAIAAPGELGSGAEAAGLAAFAFLGFIDSVATIVFAVNALRLQAWGYWGLVVLTCLDVLFSFLPLLGATGPEDVAIGLTVLLVSGGLLLTLVLGSSAYQRRYA